MVEVRHAADDRPERVVALFGAAAGLGLAERLKIIDAERAPLAASPTLRHRYGYLGFSARTGEIGSLKGLRLLFSAAMNNTPPEGWLRSDGRYADPLRPRIEPDGIATSEELRLLQQHHLRCVRNALTLAEEVVLVLGGATGGHDTLTGMDTVCLPDASFPPELRARIRPHVPDLDDLDRDFTEIWQMLRAVRPDVRITVALAPPVSGQTESRAWQHHLSCLRILADEWVWRFPDVAYLPLWDVAMARRTPAEATLWTQAEQLLTAPPPADEDATPIQRPARKPRKAPSTVCEDELLDAFSK